VAPADSERTRCGTDDELPSGVKERGRGARGCDGKIKSHLTCGANWRRVWARREARSFPNTSPFASRRAARLVSLGIARTCGRLARRRAKGSRTLFPAATARPASRLSPGSWRRGSRSAAGCGARARGGSVREHHRPSGRAHGRRPPRARSLAPGMRGPRPRRPASAAGRLTLPFDGRGPSGRSQFLGCTMSDMASMADRLLDEALKLAPTSAPGS
jgi:hypothetical protein